MKYITSTYNQANHRLLLLDYDGTLVPFTPRPEQSKPSALVINLLQKLAADPANKIVIISGRDRQTLDTWLGHLPIDISAEHGIFTRMIGRSWQQHSPADHDWQEPVRALFEAACQKAPGSFIETKSVTIVWHYRQALTDVAEPIRQQLLKQLEALCKRHGCTFLDGNKVVEVKPIGIDKGTAAAHWLNQKYDFILAAGDDVTDEKLFQSMPPKAFTIKIGQGQTAAREHVDNVDAFLALLKTLVTD